MVPYFLYKGHTIKILAWEPNFNDKNLEKNIVPSWYEYKNIPPKLNKRKILYKLSLELGELIGINMITLHPTMSASSST